MRFETDSYIIRQTQTNRFIMYTLRGKLPHKFIEWHPHGKLKMHYMFGGESRSWYDNGQLASHEIPNKSKKSWYNNGNLFMHDDYENQISQSWYRNGELKYFRSPTHKAKWWDKMGNEINI